jgi:hypothetical protein
MALLRRWRWSMMALLPAVAPWLLTTLLVPTPTPVVAADPPSPELKSAQYMGKVVPLADLLAKTGVKLDVDAEPAWFALVTDDGKTYPLIKDAGSRMFFKDKRLLDRPVRVTGKLREGSLLQVLLVHTMIKGEPHEVFYWCEVCSIRRFEKTACECCGGPMELRETPLKK